MLRYQHRESEFFPEENTKSTTNAYGWFPATVTIDGQRFASARLRKKGYIGSNDTRRPGLKIQLVHGQPSPIPELTLNNNKQDPSLVRQYLVYEVFRRAGVPAPRCSFAQVTVNGTPLGIFTHVEDIKKPFLKAAFGREDGALYEGGRSDFRSGWFQNYEIKAAGHGQIRADLQAATRAIEDKDQPLLPPSDLRLGCWGTWHRTGIRAS